MSAATARPLALTMGEPAGIGGEITLQAWRDRGPDTPPFFVIDHPPRLADLCRRLDWPVPLEILADPASAVAVFGDALPVLPIELPQAVRPGLPDTANAAAVIESIDRGIDLVAAGAAAALVTNPIHKRILFESGFQHPGHTDYLAERAGRPGQAVMMLVSHVLRVVPVTVHIPLSRVAQVLSADAIHHCGRITAEALESDFAIAAPRIAVAGLNPHAGEDGALGTEEADIIAPAIARLRGDGIAAVGPAAADSLFHDVARQHYDAALCMYHDQALIPLKALDFDGGVNVTLGLPFVRTSPDHGTALDIAGSGKANPRSLIEALKLAASMAATRFAHN
jgi:4-hydroxythreonine-4-phosphate dehydrogenase